MTAVPDLNDMLFFAEVVERGGFAAAGRALGVPKSRLSRRVAELEAQLGVRLLHRSTRHLSLTGVGDSFWRHCMAMRESAQAAADAVAQVQAEPRGTVRVVCPVTLAQTVVGPLLPQYLETFPLVRIDLEVNNRVVDLVAEGVDVALRVRTSLDASGSLVVKKLDLAQQVLVASPALLARQGTPGTPEDASRMDSLAMSVIDGQSVVKLVGPAGQEAALTLTPRLVANDLLTLKWAALGGSGLCWLPDYMCEAERRDGRLVQLLPEWRCPTGEVHAVFASRRGMAPAVRSFLDFLGEKVPTCGQLWRQQVVIGSH